MTTLDAKADLIRRLQNGHDAITPAPGARYYHVPPTALELEAAAYLESLPPQPVEVTEEMVERAATAVIREWKAMCVEADMTPGQIAREFVSPSNHRLIRAALEAAFTSHPSGDGIRAGRAEVIEE